MDADVVVIGAGIGGLSAAVRLAVAGRRVLVLEKNTSPGGKMAEVLEGGFRWDTGPSVITMRPVLEDLFATAGRRLTDCLDLVPVEPLTRYFFPDGSRLDLSRDLPRTLEAISRIEPRDAAGYLGFLSRAARLDRISAPVFTFGPPPSIGSLRRISLADSLSVLPSVLRTYNAEVERYVRSPLLRQLLDRFATYVGSDPYRATAMLAVIAQVELNQGIWYPRGGVYAIARSLAQLAKEVGVDLRLGEQVDQIAYSHSWQDKFKVEGVFLAGGDKITAPVVIANLDVATVYERMLPAQPIFQRRLRRLERNSRSCSGFILLLAVEGEHPELAHHNIFFSADYRREFEQIFKQGVPPDDPTIYLAITSRTDPGHAPRGCENWFVLVNAPAMDGGYDWEQETDAYADRVLARMADRGFEVRDRLKFRKAIAPPDLERSNAARRGSLYGISFNDRLAPFKRPNNRCPDMAGLFFVGGTTHPGGGVPMVMLSGKLVAGLISGVE